MLDYGWHLRSTRTRNTLSSLACTRINTQRRMHAYCMSIIMGLACLGRRRKSMENNHITCARLRTHFARRSAKTNRHLFVGFECPRRRRPYVYNFYDGSRKSSHSEQLIISQCCVQFGITSLRVAAGDTSVLARRRLHLYFIDC